MPDRFSDAEVEEIAGVLYSCVEDPEGYNLHQRDRAISYLARHPHVLFSQGYDEARIFSQANVEARKQVAGYLSEIEVDVEIKSEPFKGSITHEAILRNQQTGQWEFLYYIWGEGITDGPLSVVLIPPKGSERRIEIDSLISQLNADSTARPDRMHLVLPTIWVPPPVPREDILVASFTRNLMYSVHQGRTSLHELSWRQLEEIVAELLKTYGLSVELTPKTRDGGRDIIAVGEFFPGLKSTLVVEVTSTASVGIGKLAQALYRNRYFPTVMLATSGKFSAGVIAEAELPENRFRLVLRDGDALHQWITEAVRLEPR
jgi:hypothetical protein